MQVRASVVALISAGAVVASSPQPSALAMSGFTPMPCPQQSWQLSDATFTALPDAKAFFGRNDGGLYRIEIPKRWNGELVLFAHGYTPLQGPNGSTLHVAIHPIREHLIEKGFAWAASSYRCNGYVPGQGLLDTMALVDQFTKLNDGRAPPRTYVTGESMGGLITIRAMHAFPTAFAGGLAMCGGAPELFDFFAGTAAAAEVLTGVQLKPDSLQQDIGRMSAALGTPPDYTDKGRELGYEEIRISGGPRPFAVEGLASEGTLVANMVAGAPVIAGVDAPLYRAAMTTQIKYSDALDQRVRRKSADPVYRSDQAPYGDVVPFDGKIARPLLTMHGTGDLRVPIFLERELKHAVVSARTDRLLTQRVYRIPGHCGFSKAEQIKAFDDLVKWVRQGVKPEGDNVDADFEDAGMKFTDPLREHDPGGLQVKLTTTAGGRDHR